MKFIILVLGLVTTGCGMQGDLYLPAEQPVNNDVNAKVNDGAKDKVVPANDTGEPVATD